MMMKRVLAIILGGGQGTRLYPLTQQRAKPAVPIAGKHRLIDIPISNCINSGISRTYVLTQFNSASLNQHISRSYGFSNLQQGFIEVLAAQQTPENLDWFQGTADAVRQYLQMFQELDIEEFLILSGDHLYRMDYSDFVQHHRQTGADITLSVLPIDEARASSFGLMKINDDGRIQQFSEKPTGEELKQMRVDTSALGLSEQEAKEKPYIASMGIYLFKRQVLVDLLKNNPTLTDFGKEIIPQSAASHQIQAYLFNDYWEDIGTIDSFFQANLALAQQPNPPFSFYQEGAPIYTRSRHLPPTKQLDCHIIQSMVSEGCILKQCHIKNSIIGIRSRIDSGCHIENSLLMGADYYVSNFERQGICEDSKVALGIGANTRIENAIIDKNARIGCDVKIVNKDRVQEADRESDGFCIRSGIVTVLKNATIADRTII